MSHDPQREISRVAQLVTAARRLSRPLRTLGILSLVAGCWLWSLPVSPGTLARWWTIVGAGLLLIVLASPAVVVLLFYAGVRQIVDLPSKMEGMTKGGVDKGKQVLAAMRAREDTPVKRRGTILRGIFDLARAAFEAKGLVFDTVSLIRLLNPLTLVIVSVAVVAGVVLIAVAAVSAVVVVVF